MRVLEQNAGVTSLCCVERERERCISIEKVQISEASWSGRDDTRNLRSLKKPMQPRADQTQHDGVFKFLS